LSGRAARRAGRPVPRASASFPLDAAYSHAGIDPPHVEVIDPARLPSRAARLLVHGRTMTRELERACGERVVLRPLWIGRADGWYLRRVLLARSSSGRPVEMGAMAVRLPDVPAPLRRQIVLAGAPLGRLLADPRVYTIRPLAFLRIIPNAEMLGVFWLKHARPLYGRQTEILRNGRVIGHVVEVLPPGR
jgi:chorismate-pyruvate lyase